MILSCLDWWVFELMVILSGYFYVQDQAALVIAMNICGLLFMVTAGFQQSATTLIGKVIGSGSIKETKEYY